MHLTAIFQIVKHFVRLIKQFKFDRTFEIGIAVIRHVAILGITRTARDTQNTLLLTARLRRAQARRYTLLLRGYRRYAAQAPLRAAFLRKKNA